MQNNEVTDFNSVFFLWDAFKIGSVYTFDTNCPVVITLICNCIMLLKTCFLHVLLEFFAIFYN